MKKLVVFVLSWMMMAAGMAQQKPLMAEQEGGELFIRHTVAPKENWYSIGRLYNASPKDMAAFNNTDLNKGLAIGQKLKIPLGQVNFLQGGQPGADEALIPLYHTVKEKEGLYRIGQSYNKVSSEQLKSWNKLSSDELPNGKNLIVGYLKVKKELSPLAKGGQTVATPTTVVSSDSKPAEKPTQTEVKVTDKKEAPPVVQKQDPPVKPVETKPVTTAPAQSGLPAEGGAFKGLFEEQARSGSNKQTFSGKAAAFKSTSGWKDAKYYVLMNKTSPGTVVKITNPVNGKFVYAKVLGEIPPIKENDGLLVRISNAATNELLLDDGRYEVDVIWTKQ